MKLSLRASGTEGNGIRAEGSVAGRLMRGSWVSGHASGHFCLHLVSADCLVWLDDPALDRRGRVDSPLLRAGSDSPTSRAPRDGRREWGEYKTLWGQSQTEVDEDHVRVESCTFRSLTAASSVVQHRLALSKDNAYFEVLLLDDPIKGVDAKHKWSVGVAAHERHKADTHVGWMEGSVGYHPKDGTLYDGRLERMHELYDTATVGDVVGCGCIFTDGKEITVKRIFFTKNGALVGSVNCEGWEKLGRPPVASVGLEGEGVRIVVMSSVIPPLLEPMMVAQDSARVQAAVCLTAGTQVWAGVLDSFDDSGEEVIVHVLATANRVEGAESNEEAVEFELFGEGLRGKEGLVASGTVGPQQDMQLLLWSHVADVVNPATITCNGRMQGRCMRGTWFQEKRSGHFRMNRIASEGGIIGEGTAQAKTESKDPILDLKGSDISLHHIPQLNEDMWCDLNVMRLEDLVEVNGAVMRVAKDALATVQHIEPLSVRR